MARRNSARASGLRELLLDSHRASLERWRLRSVDDLEAALVSGAPVVVSSAQIMRALMHAGLPHADYTRGGALGNRRWLLSERGELTESG